jgi:two-component system response regulator PilR (NtrC family)
MKADLPFRVLVVDDEPDLRTLYELTLLRQGYEVEVAGDVEHAELHLRQHSFHAVITDMRLPDGSGLELLRRLETQQRREKVIVITAYGSAENAVEALKAGAYDYLTKPVDLKQFRRVVASALGPSDRARESDRLTPWVSTQPAQLLEIAQPATKSATRSGPRRTTSAAPIVPSSVQAGAPLRAVGPATARMAGQSPAMDQVRDLIEKVARSMAPVLVTGESGTGKELVARSIHEVSSRAHAPFVAVNCGAIPEHLLEAEFFGYKKGAFTGAAQDREGFFQAASGGTLFLDEIGELPLAMQSKLLRAIQERAVRPVGAVMEIPVDVRLLSATNRDLGGEATGGRFRQDLYYRLNVIQIRVPPLRERLEDLLPICERVLEQIARDAGSVPPHRLGMDAVSALKQHAFTGNIRELENMLHRAVALATGTQITAADLGLVAAPVGDEITLPSTDLFGATTAFGAADEQDEVDLPHDLVAHLDAVERGVLVRALEAYRFNRTAAGARLGLSLRQMRYRMARLGIQEGVDVPAEREST